MYISVRLLYHPAFIDIHLLCNMLGCRDMSSDTAKENASVVDSSVTEWKQDMGNSDDPGSK